MIHIIDGKTDRILSVIDESEFWEDKHTKSLKDTLETFDFTTFANKSFSEYLAERNRVIIPGEDGEYIEFIIENTRKFHGADGLFIEVYTSASYIELAKAKVIDPQTTPSWTAKQHAEMALSGTEWAVGTVDFAGSRTIIIESYTNPYSYLKQIASEFNLELHFRVETDGNKVTRRYVDLIEHVGGWNGREVEFGKDLMGIERKEDFSNIVTALVGIGPERDDGTRLQVFVEDKDALARWGRNGKHLIDVYEPDSSDSNMTLERLRSLTEAELAKRINSTVEYTGDVVDLEKVPGLEHEKFRFGDTIRIKDTAFTPPLYLEARIHTVERSIKQNGQKTVTLGDYIEYTEEDVFAIYKRLRAEIEKKVSLSQVMEVTYTKEEIDTKDTNVKIEAAQDATNKANAAEYNAKQYAESQAQQAEQNAKDHADSIAEQKKQEAIQAAIADADAKLSAARTELEAEIAEKVDAEWVNGQLQLKENKIVKSNTAPSNPIVDQLWLDTSSSPNVLKRWNGSAWVKATPTSAGEVGAYTKTEVDNALNSKVSVTQYNTDMNGVITRLNSAESRITQTEQEIATKVSETTYQQDKAVIEGNISDLQTRMTNAETAITQNAQQIALKANKTDVYTKTEVDNQLANKADNSTVSAIEQRVTQAEAQLTVQAEQIASKVSRTEFESLKIGGRNLIKNSGNFKTIGNWTTNGPGTSITLTQKDGFSVLEGIKSITGENVTNIKNGTEYVFSAEVMFDRDVNLTSNNPLHCHVAISENVHGGKESVTLISKDTVAKANTWTVIAVKIKTKSDVTITHFKPFIFGLADGTKFWVKWWKLEEGNKPTAWSPAPEDVDEQISGLDTRLSTAETSIIQNAEQIALKANQSEVDTLTGRVSNAESQIRVLSDEIDLKVDKNGVISAINLSNEQARILAEKILLDGYVEAKHIKSLNGLNINDKFIIDQNGNVTFAGILNGASGTFNGHVIVNTMTVDEYGNTITNSVTLEDGQVSSSYHVDGYGNAYTIDKKAILRDGGITFYYADNDYELDSQNEYHIHSNAGRLVVNHNNGLGIDVYVPEINLYGNTIGLHGNPITSHTETGFCGVGGVTTGLTGPVAGVGVNFRTKKTYTPSSISLSGTSHNLIYSTHLHAIDISPDGFWLYIDGGATNNAYRYWRGYYTA